jgi:hypothetical protein
VDFGEAPVATIRSPSLRRTSMTEPQKRRKRGLSPSVQSGQISIAFESIGLLGLTSTQRMKAVIQLSQLLMLAADVAVKEHDDEH